MGRDDTRLSLHFRVVPTNAGPTATLNVDVPGRMSGPVPASRGLLPFAAVMLRYKIEAMRSPTAAKVSIDEGHFPGHTDVFHAAWHYVKNVTRDDTPVKAGLLLRELRDGVVARELRGRKVVEVDARALSSRQQYLSYSLIGRGGVPREPATEDDLIQLFDALLGRRPVEEVLLGGSNGGTGARVTTFRFGIQSTGTRVVRKFREGLSPDSLVCSLTGEPYGVPDEIEALVDRAHAVLRQDPPGARTVAHQPMLAPRRVDCSIVDYDSGREQVAIAFADASSYRYYAAFAFAEMLADHDDQFEPLWHFARSTPDPFQPAPASCSMGVRVLLETSDEKLIVAYRSGEVKLNPHVWSVSANEGLRRSLLTPGRGCEDLLRLAVSRAVTNELRLREDECHQAMLMSVYRNEFNQWGAGLWVRAGLSADEVIRRQPAAKHAFEHGRLAALPTDLDGCGRAMRLLGERWYGGALETICQVLAWRELASGHYVEAEEVGAALSRAAGGAIRPVDEPNPAMMP